MLIMGPLAILILLAAVAAGLLGMLWAMARLLRAGLALLWALLPWALLVGIIGGGVALALAVL